MTLLPEGYSAWAHDGRPVRRVATNGNATVPRSMDLAGTEAADAVRLLTDAAVFGDAWVDLEGRRVPPMEVDVVAAEVER